MLSSLKLILTKYFTKSSQTLLDGLGGYSWRSGPQGRSGRPGGLEAGLFGGWPGVKVESGLLCGAVAGGSEVVPQLCLELV